jgi:hypothetical protein
MQCWEYLTVAYLSNSWSDSLGRRGELPSGFDYYTGDPTGLLNDLGEQGWELCGVASKNGNNVYQLFLKRPRP